jgi:hypothetical protein
VTEPIAPVETLDDAVKSAAEAIPALRRVKPKTMPKNGSAGV